VLIGIIKISSQATCNSFPKIFGGSGSDSVLYHIDVFADYLAMVGDTWDNTLAGLSYAGYIPFIAVTSVAIPDYYYWAKVLYLEKSSDLYGVQFSTDGTLLIAHSHSISNSSFIVVFDVATGAVKSARSYSSGGYYNFDHRIKSMVISSGPSPMAYVLSNN
jgi:hypothetical protein